MNELKAKFNTEISKISKMFDEFPFEEKSTLISWMCQQYYLIQHSTRYLSYAASRVDPNENGEFKEWLHHLNEEVDHDKGLYRDIKKLNKNSDIEPMSPDTKALIGALYYDIQENGPDALLGYALLLEGLSCEQCSKLVSRIKESHGITSGYLQLHATVDEEHFPEGLEKITELSPEKAKIVESNLLMSSRLYENFLNGLNISQRSNFKKVA